MSTNWPAVSKRPSMSRRFRPLSMTCVRPSARGFPGRGGRFRKPSLKPGNDALQSSLCLGLNVVVERIAVRADAELLVAPFADLAHARRGVEKERAAQVHRRLHALVEDADLRAVADTDDVPLDGHLVARTELEDLLRVGDRKRDLVRGHGYNA